MKKIFTFLSLIFLAGITSAQVWNISSDNFKSLGSITATRVVDGLTIHAATDKAVDVDANVKSLGDLNFTHRVKFNGTGAFNADGTPLNRVISFPVAGKTTITVIGMSGSTTADRIMNISVNHKDSIKSTFNALGAAIGKVEYTWTGGAANIYLWSSNSGINLYYIEAKALTSNLSPIDKSKPYKVQTEYYNIAGVSVGKNYDALQSGIFIRKTTFNDGSVKADKISKLKQR